MERFILELGALVRPGPEIRESQVTDSLSREVATFITNQNTISTSEALAA
jgi:hypothetical protein